MLQACVPPPWFPEDLRQLITWYRIRIQAEDPPAADHGSGSGSRCCSPRGLISALCASALVFIRPEPLRSL